MTKAHLIRLFESEPVSEWVSDWGKKKKKIINPHAHIFTRLLFFIYFLKVARDLGIYVQLIFTGLATF